jgi:hypothetical protein
MTFKITNIEKEIIERFDKNIRGKSADTSASKSGHDGKRGHWLERQMGIKPNASKSPDLLGYEMKDMSPKITFGDWSPSTAIWKGKAAVLSRRKFLMTFGQPNPQKDDRYSWSGKPCPLIKGFNDFGQILRVDKEGNINALYSYSKDGRRHKKAIIPKDLQVDDLVLATWKMEKMKKHVEKKFNDRGWISFIVDKQGIYKQIVFGSPINFEMWIEGVRSGAVFFDSGMYEGNPRPYSQWRANHSFWDLLVVHKH